jgi:sRNA-binding protein
MSADLKHYHRDERDAGVEILATKYPACFFLQSQMRRPLKRAILSDLIKDTAPAERELLTVSLQWYMEHFGYHYSLRPGAKRVDLNGKEVGVVTETEARNAQTYIRSRQKELQERQIMKSRPSLVANPTVAKPDVAAAVVLQPPADDLKIVASPTDPMAQLRDLFDAVLALRDQPEALRRPLAIAGLRAVVAEIEKCVTTLEA